MPLYVLILIIALFIILFYEQKVAYSVFYVDIQKTEVKTTHKTVF